MLYKTLMLLSYLACRTPRKLLLAVGWVLGNLYYLLIPKMRRRAVEQMMPALQIDERTAKKLVRASFINMARNVFDILAMPMLNEQNLSDYIEIDHLERMGAGGCCSYRAYRLLGVAFGSIHAERHACQRHCKTAAQHPVYTCP